MGWMVLGTALRFTNLLDKPLWTDEFATLVFSLGHSFRTIPLDQPIDGATLLAPALDPHGAIAQVTHYLFSESNHPPLYFLLTHQWLQLFPSTPTGLVLGARSLAAFFGVLSIPATFGLSWIAFRSMAIAQVAATLMAVSPFAIYLAQEARHYTLPILWILGSLACLVTVGRSLRQSCKIPWGIAIIWILVNGLGLATHYFFALFLMAMAIALGVWELNWQRRHPFKRLNPRLYLPIGVAALGTFVSGLVWLPLIQGTQDSELTQWIYESDRAGWDWLEPIGQSLAGWITMLYLMPIPWILEIAVLSLPLLALFIWTVVWIIQGLRSPTLTNESRPIATLLIGVVLSAIALFFGITYLLGIDLTSAFRYNFVYFPAVAIVVSVGLAAHWQPAQRWSRAKTILVTLLLCSVLGSITVVSNLGYQKTHRPDLVTQSIQRSVQANPDIPVLVTIAHRTHGQTGRLMAIAWEWQQTNRENLPSPQYLLAHQAENPRSVVRTLNRTLNQSSFPIDLWLINMQQIPDRPLNRILNQHHCAPLNDAISVDGYKYQQIQCRDSKPSIAAF